jgi:hypothetical protein
MTWYIWISYYSGFEMGVDAAYFSPGHFLLKDAFCMLQHVESFSITNSRTCIVLIYNMCWSFPCAFLLIWSAHLILKSNFHSAIQVICRREGCWEEPASAAGSIPADADILHCTMPRDLGCWTAWGVSVLRIWRNVTSFMNLKCSFRRLPSLALCQGIKTPTFRMICL